jgi:signal transduction histidine kinase
MTFVDYLFFSGFSQSLSHLSHFIVTSTTIAIIGYYYGKLNDVHSVLITQNRLIRNNHEKLLEQLRSKDEFINTTSHELKTPLTNIKGYMQLLVDGEVGKIKNNQKKILVFVIKTVEDLITLIDGIIDITKSKAEEVKLSIKYVSLNKVLSEIIHSMDQLLRVKDVKLKIDIPQTFFVKADEQKIKRVIYNLVENAIKFSYDGGTVEVEAFDNRKEVLITVTDHGIGIDNDRISRIFDKYYQGPTSGPQEGCGIGLSECKKFVAEHNGKIWVNSELSKGSIFYLSLPK